VVEDVRSFRSQMCTIGPLAHEAQRLLRGPSVESPRAIFLALPDGAVRFEVKTTLLI